jgi:hypothetical protein
MATPGRAAAKADTLILRMVRRRERTVRPVSSLSRSLEAARQERTDKEGCGRIGFRRNRYEMIAFPNFSRAMRRIWRIANCCGQPLAPARFSR